MIHIPYNINIWLRLLYLVRVLYVVCITHHTVLNVLTVLSRYLHERFVQLQEEVSLLKANLMKYKVSGEQSNET